MDDRKLGELLTQIDAAEPAPAGADLLGGAIVRKARRQRRNKLAAGVLCVVVVAAGLTLQVRPARQIVATAPAPQPDEATINSQLALANQTVSDLLLAERSAATQEQLHRLQTRMNDSDVQREQTAVTVLAAANDLSDGPQAAAYRRVIQTFPGTGAAIVAQRQLAAIQ